jgi:hypothetical protein
MQASEALQYVYYSEYKNFDGVEVQWPIEISEDIATDIIDYVRKNMRFSEINSEVRIYYIKK